MVTHLDWRGNHLGGEEREESVSASWSSARGDEDEVGAGDVGHESFGGWWQHEEEDGATPVMWIRWLEKH